MKLIQKNDQTILEPETSDEAALISALTNERVPVSITKEDCLPTNYSRPLGRDHSKAS